MRAGRESTSVLERLSACGCWAQLTLPSFVEKPFPCKAVRPSLPPSHRLRQDSWI